MLNGLLGPHSGDRTMSELFGDVALVQAACQYEATWVQACARAGLLSAADAAAIDSVLGEVELSTAQLIADAHHAGTLAIPLVAALQNAVRTAAPGLEAHVHRGSTSQDMLDTVLVVQCVKASAALRQTVSRLGDVLAQLAQRHAMTPMLGRTLMRGALPITFGLKVSHWLVGIRDGVHRVQTDTQALGLQFGGAVGTLSDLQGCGLEVAALQAELLGLPPPRLPWHTRRHDTLALACSLTLLGGALGKVANDIVLLGQDEITEVQESNTPGRGGSSAMAHKRNPTGCQQVLSGVQRLPGLTQQMMQSLQTEHERGIGGWQSELGTLAQMYVWTHDAACVLLGVIDSLVVDSEAMRRNLLAAGVGTDIGDAQKLVQRALEDTGAI